MKKKNIFSGHAALYIKRGALTLVSLTMLSTTLYASTTAKVSPKETGVKEALQDQRSVQGVVTDDLGEPLIGVTVKVIGTTAGTITDLDGNFSISVTGSNASLEFSYVGHITQTVKAGDKSDFNIVLETDSKMLDQVVVTALGLKRSEKALGYAVTEVRGEDLKGANTISPVAALQGKVAGLEIAQSDGGMFGATKIQIRGASTFSGNNQPIFVIDGIILDNGVSGNDDLNWGANSSDYGNELKNLNPDDFETISVLKGSAATALYGSRGLHGVIVITTKSGKGSTGLGISFSQTLGWDHAYKTPDIQTTYGDGPYVGRYDANGNGNIWEPSQFQVANGKNTLIGTWGTGFGPKYDGSEIENYDGTMTRYSPRKNNMLDMYETGFNTNTNVSVRGGNEKTTFYSSISYKKANSTTPNNTFERYSFLTKGSHKLSDRVEVSASINFSNSTPRNAARNIGENFVNGKWTPLYDSKFFRNKYLGDHGGLASVDYGDLYGNVPNKDYWFEIDNFDYRQKETVVRPTFDFDVKITDWLSFKGDANMNYYYTRGENKQLGKGYANEGGYYEMWQNTKEQTTFGGAFTANKAFNKFNIGGFARFEYYNAMQSSYNIMTDGGMVVPGEWFVDNSIKAKKSKAGIDHRKRIISAISAINMSWDNQFFLDLTARNDWSSALVYSNGIGNHSFFYPSVSGAWLINETFELPSWVTLSKVRASWAQVGNDTDPYTINQAYGFDIVELPNGNNIYVNTLDKMMKNKDLKPERKNSWEFGLDLRTFDSRLNLDVTYYKENTNDQIMKLAVPDISGVNERLINAGNIQNQGIEIALNTIPFRNKEWEVGLNFTWTKNEDKITELHPDAAAYVPLAGEANNYDYRIGSVAKVGGSFGLLMTDILPARDEQGRILLNYSDSRRTAYQRRSGQVEELGDMTPDFLGSMGADIRWKDLNLHIGLDARIGGLVAMYSNRYGSNAGWTKSSMAYRDKENGGLEWTSRYEGGSNGITYNDGVILDGVFAPGTPPVTGIDGQKHDISGLTHQEAVERGIIEPTHASAYHVFRNAWGEGTINDDWVHKLSYVALRDITLSYKLPRTWASRVGAKNVGVSVSGRNLGYLYNSLPNNVHPESVRGNRSAEFRIRGYEPYVASYMFSVNAEF